MSVCLSVLVEQLRPTGQIFMKLDMWVFFWKSVEKIQISLKSEKNKG
jgi:hypothetical protein